MDERRGLLFVVDEDPHVSVLVAELMRAEGYGVSIFASGDQVLRALTEATPSAVLLDLKMPDLGEAALERVVSLNRHLPVLVLTEERDPARVGAMLRRKAYDFLPKPIEQARLRTSVANAVEKHSLALRVAQLERQQEGFPGVVGASFRMRELVRQLERAASTDVTVHLRGESGTGKELVARALHDASGRRARPFVTLRCAGLPGPRQETELFGSADTPGRLEQVEGGTLFLDDVDELSAPAQARLLRVLQERTVQRVGGQRDLPVDLRLVTASTRALSEAVRQERYREELYFRLVVFELEMPPLREREGDVARLVEHFLHKHAPRLVNTLPFLDPQALTMLSCYRWPGNVRELENVVQRALVKSDRQSLKVGDLPPRVTQHHAADAPPVPAPSVGPPPPAPTQRPPPTASPPVTPSPAVAVTLEVAERLQTIRSLEACNGNRPLAAHRLGIARSALERRLKAYGLE